MSEKGQALLLEAMQLDAEERRWLAETIFDSIESDPEGIAIANARLEALERGEAHLVPFEEAMNSLKR
jgi:hypothetical protein